MKKIKKRLKRLWENFKNIKWVKPKALVKEVLGVIIFTIFFILLFAAIDFVGSIFAKFF